MSPGGHCISRRGARAVDLGGGNRVNPQRLAGVWLNLGGLGLRPTHWQLEKERRGEEREEKTGNSYSYLQLNPIKTA